MNLELFDQIKAAIREEPRRLHMPAWFVDGPAEAESEGIELPPCGTASCIAGWALRLGDPAWWRGWHAYPSAGESISEAAARVLGVEVEGAYNLFYKTWPPEIAAAHDEAPPGSAERAEAACAAIDAFVAGGGRF